MRRAALLSLLALAAAGACRDSPGRADATAPELTSIHAPRLEGWRNKFEVARGNWNSLDAATPSWVPKLIAVPWSAHQPLRPGMALSREADGWHAAASANTTGHVLLPTRADGAMSLRDRRSGMSVRVWLEGARAAEGEAIDGVLFYPAATSDGDDIVQRASDDGVEDFLILQQRPSQPVRYQLDVSEVAGLRHVGGTVEMLDDSGTPRLRISRPWLRDASGDLHDADLEIVGCAYDTDSRPPWGRAVTPPGSEHCAIEVRLPHEEIVYPALLDPRWVSTRRMDQNRRHHTATTIDECPVACGQGPIVVVTGGFRVDGEQARDSVEAYHPPSDTWCGLAPMRQARGLHTATYVMSPQGPKLIVAGGRLTSTSSVVNSYERLPLDTFVWPPTGHFLSFLGGRAGHQAAVVIADGPSGELGVLLTGGYVTAGNQIVPSIGAPLFAPFAPQNQLFVRAGHQMVQMGLPGEERFLLVGGCFPGNDACEAWEMYCPGPDCSDAGDEIDKLFLHTATRIDDFQVLVVGGLDEDLETTAKMWVFNDTGYIWDDNITPISKKVDGLFVEQPRLSHTTSLLPGGDLLVAGGYGTDGIAGEAMRFSSGPKGWRTAGTLNVPRSGHAAALIDGKVLLCGGEDDASGTSELYIPCTDHSECSDEQYCAIESEACAPKEPVGSPCEDPIICVTDKCVDGVCCVSDCVSECDRCDLEGLVGLCSPIPAADAPTECLEQPHCLDATTVWLSDEETVDCGIYRCSAAVCKTSCNSSGDCAPSFVCDAKNKCVPLPENGGGEWFCSYRAAASERAPWLLALAWLFARSRRRRRDPARR